MGERIGFRVKDKYTTSHIFRQQWMSNVEDLVTKTWNTLLDGKEIDDGSCALRHDLDTGRAFASLVFSNYEAPFNSIQDTIQCDISDHGLVEIDVTNYKEWNIYHYEVDYNQEIGESLNEESKTLYAKMTVNGFKIINPLETLDWT